MPYSLHSAYPVAFMATFWFMSIAGYTLSGVSLFGLILVVGIVVDDAIVVIEKYLPLY